MGGTVTRRAPAFAPPEPLPWFALRDRLGREWTVALSHPRISPELSADAGAMTFPRTRRVLVNAAMGLDYTRLALVHELMHVALDERDLDGAYKEEAVRVIAGPLLGLIEAMGWALPAYPQGFAELRAWLGEES